MKSSVMDGPGASLVLRVLREAGDIVLTTHEGPDGDGLGAELALASALDRLGKRVTLVNPGPSPRRFAFLDRHDRILTYKPGLAGTVRDASAVVVVDTNEAARTGAVSRPLLDRSGPTVTIDHHPAGDGVLPGLVAPDFSSAGELMVHVIDRLGVQVDAEIAFSLYSAILFDTNQFRFSRNDPEVFAVCARLVASGADADEAGRRLFGTVPRDRVVLQGRVLGSAVFEMDGALAWANVTPEHTKDLDVDQDDVRTMVMLLAETEGVQVAVLFKVFKPGTVKVSMRSPGRIPINDIAAALGGGGHPFAAGADVAGDLEEVTRRVLPMLRERITAHRG